MIQYIQKQRNQFSCGPVAILNALKWRGDLVTYSSHYKKLIKQCQTTSDGTDSEQLEYVLERYGFNFTRTRYLSELTKHVKQGGSVILTHLDSDKEWHYSFWYEHRFGSYFGANIDCSSDIRSAPEQLIRRYLLLSEGEEYPEALLLV